LHCCTSISPFSELSTPQTEKKKGFGFIYASNPAKEQNKP